MSSFAKGDHVFYPAHGAGTVVDVSERDGVPYLSIELEHNGMTVLLPEDIAQDRGLRGVIKKAEAKRVLDQLGGDSEDLPSNTQARARLVAEQSRDADAHQLATLLRDLAGIVSDGRKLGVAESRGYEEARERLASELVYSLGISHEDALSRIDDAIGEEIV